MSDSPALAAELVSAVAGRALGLPIPLPYIVKCEKGILTDSEYHAFACQIAEGESLQQLLRSDSDRAMALLQTWSSLEKVAAFDEWLANDDRSPGNMLFRGKNDYTLIDHDRACAITSWRLNGEPDKNCSFTNELVHTLITEQLARYRLRKTSDGYQKTLTQLRPVDISAAAHIPALTGWNTTNAVVDFMDYRAQNLKRLLSAQLGLPEMSA